MQAIFKKEVVETFLRCVKMGYDQDLAVIELNGLKIAEDRTFADCARYVFGSILDLCLPAPRHTKDEYQSLYDKTAPDVSTQVHCLSCLCCFIFRVVTIVYTSQKMQTKSAYFSLLTALLSPRDALHGPANKCPPLYTMTAADAYSQVRSLAH